MSRFVITNEIRSHDRNPTIALILRTTALNDGLAESFMRSMQIQLDRDYAPVYGDSAKLVLLTAKETPDPEWWQCIFLDNSDEAEALGYHMLTPAGLPLMKTFVLDDLANGVFWTVTTSHEILEAKRDPFINRTVRVTSADGSIEEYPYEACDACEDDRYSYAIPAGDGRTHHVSDFVLPAFWDPDIPPDAALFTFQGAVDAPLTLAPGGYTGYRRFMPGETPPPWDQRFAAGLPGPRAVNKREDSRTVRRGVARPAA